MEERRLLAERLSTSRECQSSRPHLFLEAGTGHITRLVEDPSPVSIWRYGWLGIDVEEYYRHRALETTET
jgi:hypothetical protein